MYKYKESLIAYLAEFPNSQHEIVQLREDGILSKEEAAVVALRVAAEKLEKTLDSILDRPQQRTGEQRERVQSCATSCATQ